MTCIQPRCGQPIVGNTPRQRVGYCVQHAVEYHAYWVQYHQDVLDAIRRRMVQVDGQMELL